MKTLSETSISLNVIREAVDADVIDSDIINIQNKLLRLTQLIGLSAETKASAKKLQGMKEEIVFKMIDKTIPPSIQIRLLNAKCSEENAVLEYADRLNSALIHTIDALRTVISLYKSELENSLKYTGA